MASPKSGAGEATPGVARRAPQPGRSAPRPVLRPPLIRDPQGRNLRWLLHQRRAQTVQIVRLLVIEPAGDPPRPHDPQAAGDRIKEPSELRLGLIERLFDERG